MVSSRLASPAFLLLLTGVSFYLGCSSLDASDPIVGTKGTCIRDDHEFAPATYDAMVHVVDEKGAPVSGATVDVGDAKADSNGDGTATLSGLTRGVSAIVTKEGFLPEPLAFGWAAAKTPVTVKLWSSKGRIAVHSAGDVMFGRRYESPGNSKGLPLIDPDNPSKGAKAVVEGVRRIYTAADVRTLNFETVVSDLPESAAYPGKKYIIKSPPASVDGLAALAPSVAGNANNHTRDFGDDGVRDTIAALEGAKIAHMGVSSNGEQPPPVTVNANGLRVGMLAWTNLDGSYVNDVYAKDADPTPMKTDPKTAFQYQGRQWGVDSMSFKVPTASRRAGTAWDVFKMTESGATGDDDALAWGSLSKVYPEMQDWVVRRGHGGAAFWSKPKSAPQISDLKKNSDIVIVNLHVGLQFIDAPPSVVKNAAREAIDAGADMVVCHHPHVLQGFEYYKGKLIAYSLGNFVFDQDFFSTFASVMLRTIWEGSKMLAARIIPLEVSSYLPVPLTDGAARRRALRLWELSALDATSASDRDSAGHVRQFVDKPTADTEGARVLPDGATAWIVGGAPKTSTMDVTVPAGQVVDIKYDGLVNAKVGAGGDDKIKVGRDVFAWGRFEDETAGQKSRGDTHWSVQSGDCNVDTTTGTDAFEGRGFLRLVRHTNSGTEISVRPIARIPLRPHHLYDDRVNVKPLDGTATYSVRFAGRYSGSNDIELHVDGYSFEDTDLIEDPVSKITKGINLPIELPSDGAWHVIDIPIPTDVLGGDGNPSNMMFAYLRMKPTSGKSSSLDVDNLQIIEWRAASSMPDRFGVYEFIRNDNTASKDLTITGWPSAQ